MHLKLDKTHLNQNNVPFYGLLGRLGLCRRGGARAITHPYFAITHPYFAITHPYLVVRVGWSKAGDDEIFLSF